MHGIQEEVGCFYYNFPASFTQDQVTEKQYSWVLVWIIKRKIMLIGMQEYISNTN